MFRGRTNRWDELAVFVDTAAAYVAYLFVVHAYLAWYNPRVATVHLISAYFSFSVFVLAISWLALKLNFRGYSRRWNQLPVEMGMLALACVETGVAMALVIFVLKATWFSRAIFLIFPLVAWAFQTVVHSVIKLSMGHFRLSGRDQRRLVVVGYPKRVGIFSQTVTSVPEAGMQVVDVLPVELGSDGAAHSAVIRLSHLFASTVVDTLVIAMPVAEELLMPAIQMARQQGKEVRLVLDEIGVLAHRSRLYDFYGNSVLVVDSSLAHQTSRSLIKRTLDIIVAFIAIIVTSPVMVAAAIALKLDDSQGSVLFVQHRVGLNGRQFPCLKFRTMVPNAEQLRAQIAHLNVMSGPVFKIPDDPRVTRVGKWLRKSSIDELPQLFNVLVGHMSMVGPRPALPSEVKLYGPDYRKRLSVRPGITCLWQISGRSEIDFQDWMRLDMEYIDSWSLALDLKIMAKTIPAVLQQKGAH